MKVGIIVAHDVDNPSELSFSDFWILGIAYVARRLSSGHPLSLVGNDNTDLESVNNSVSCLLQPTSNETRRVATNGPDALYSPLLYLGNSVGNSQKTPYLGSVEIGGRFYLSAGFTNSMSPEYRLTFDQWHLNNIRVLSTLLVVLFTLFILSLLALFCPTIKTLKERLTLAIQNEGPEGNTSTAACQDASRVAIEHEETPKIPKSIYHDSSPIPGTGENRNLNQEKNSSSERSEMVGLPRPRGSSFTIRMEQRSGRATINKPDEFQPDTPRGAVQHYRNTKLDSAVVVGISASPVGLRSYIANKAFFKSRSRSLQLSRFNELVMFVILIIIPQVFAYCIDVFVLAIPRLFPRIACNIPSPFLTKYVFLFTYEVVPGFMYLCLPCYIIRICCFCFGQSSSNWVPSFFDRKHCFCLWKNNYICQLVFPNSSWSAYPVCDECNKAPEVEIPVNIKNNLDYIFSVEMLLEKMKCMCHLYQKFQECWAQLENEEARKIYKLCISLAKWSLLILCILPGLIILFFILLAVYIIVSLPAISLGYGRVWFTLDCVKNRCLQFCCLMGEFLVILFSIVWIVYFSFCCSLSLTLALITFYIVGVNYPAEILASATCYIMVGLLFWYCYRSCFTSVYENLCQELIKTCRSDHESELSRYKEGDVINIPLKLFTSACVKLKPIGDSLQNLFFRLIVLVLFLYLIFSIAMGSSNGIPASRVLVVVVGLLVCIWALLSYIEQMRGKDEEFVGRVKDHVDAFFKGKLD